MRRPIIGGNWKMNKTLGEAEQFAKGIAAELEGDEGVDTVIFPPFISVRRVGELLEDTDIEVGAQNMFWEEKGAYTGEVSPLMLKDAGCTYVILGHSERRQYFGESDESINKKIRAAFEAALLPVVCVGERLQERKKGMAEKVVESQLRKCFSGLDSSQVAQIVVAYEPIWAIGTGETATPQQAQHMHQFIRNILQELYNQDTANLVRIQYGGSVKAHNIKQLMEQPDIDGALVGGASLKVDSFAKIVKYKGE